MSLPKQNPDFADLKAAYRFLSNSRVRPEDIRAPHRTHAEAACRGRGVVLCVQDSTDIDFTGRAAKGLGIIGNGGGRGFGMHSTLAITTAGEILGVLDQRFFIQTETLTSKETRRQRDARWRESMLWAEGIERVGPAPQGCRYVLVADRASDCFGTMLAAMAQGHGFVIRAKHDRAVEGASVRLWEWAKSRPVAATRSVRVGRQSTGRVKRIERDAEVSVRFGPVTLGTPVRTEHEPLEVWAVHVHEDEPPEGVEPIDWMLLTSEPVRSAQDALERMDWYARRWVIEEWHRVLKEGCRLEAAQLDHAEDLQRLAVILGIVAAWLLQLRDLARRSLTEPPQRAAAKAGGATGGGQAAAADGPAMLRACVPEVWIRVVATFTRLNAERMTPRDFWMAIARRGGFIGRKSDGWPGWKCIWRGWYDFQQMVLYAEAAEGTG